MKETQIRARIENAVLELQNSWKNLSIESIYRIKTIIGTLARDPELILELQSEARNLFNGIELHRDSTENFVLLAYAESQGTYRPPHNHGSAWVVYAVAAGEVNMGSYFEASSANKPHHLILKAQETLTAGNTRIYLPGEIHDTRCISENAVIIRLTSLDLKEEEKAGRMKRYQI